MPDEPTKLDQLRAGYVTSILQAVNDPGADDGGRFMVDNLLAEWGAKAYEAGRQSLVDQVMRLGGRRN